VTPWLLVAMPHLRASVFRCGIVAEPITWL
jgi:hypothetical protein